MALVIDKKFSLLKKLGSGSFGEVFESNVIHIDNQDEEIPRKVALKLEPLRSVKYNGGSQIENEIKIYENISDCINVPKIYCHGTDKNAGFNYLAMDELGYSLDHLFSLCQRNFNLKTVLMIVDQTLSTIEYIHKKNIIYRDIKLDNFVIGTGKNENKIYLVDFGLSQFYIDQETNNHIEYKEDLPITGTARYASVNALLGRQQSRRDDMIALGYMYIYLLKGTLPWIGLGNNNENYPNENGNVRRQVVRNIDEKCALICEIKRKTPLKKLCANIPSQFLRYMEAVESLGFEEEPKYSDYRKMFRALFNTYSLTYDYVYEWTNNPLFHPPNIKNNVQKPYKLSVSPRLFPPTPREKKLMKESAIAAKQQKHPPEIQKGPASSPSPKVSFNLGGTPIAGKGSPRFNSRRSSRHTNLSQKLPPIDDEDEDQPPQKSTMLNDINEIQNVQKLKTVHPMLRQVFTLSKPRNIKLLSCRRDVYEPNKMSPLVPISHQQSSHLYPPQQPSNPIVHLPSPNKLRHIRSNVNLQSIVD